MSTRQRNKKPRTEIAREFNFPEDREDLAKCADGIAKRDPVGYRYDILYWPFLEMMAKIAAYGAQKYGNLNWQKSRLTGEKGPMNHLMNHLKMYQEEEDYDHLKEVGSNPKVHLAAIAFNAMLEYWYFENARGK